MEFLIDIANPANTRIKKIHCRSKEYIDSISAPPTIKIIDPDPGKVFFFRANKVDTIKWKTTLSPPFKIEIFYDFKDSTIMFDSLTLTPNSLTKDSISKDSIIYTTIWSPNYEKIFYNKGYEGRAILKVSKVNKDSSEISDKRNSKDIISDKRDIILKRAIVINSPQAPWKGFEGEYTTYSYYGSIHHVWKIDEEFKRSPPDKPKETILKIIKQEIKEEKKQKNDTVVSVVYTDTISDNTDTYRVDREMIKESLPIPKEDLNKAFYEQMLYSKIQFKEDTNVYDKTRSYKIFCFNDCDKMQSNIKKLGNKDEKGVEKDQLKIELTQCKELDKIKKKYQAIWMLEYLKKTLKEVKKYEVRKEIVIKPLEKKIKFLDTLAKRNIDRFEATYSKNIENKKPAYPGKIEVLLHIIKELKKLKPKLRKEKKYIYIYEKHMELVLELMEELNELMYGVDIMLACNKAGKKNISQEYYSEHGEPKRAHYAYTLDRCIIDRLFQEKKKNIKKCKFYITNKSKAKEIYCRPKKLTKTIIKKEKKIISDYKKRLIAIAEELDDDIARELKALKKPKSLDKKSKKTSEDSLKNSLDNTKFLVDKEYKGILKKLDTLDMKLDMELDTLMGKKYKKLDSLIKIRYKSDSLDMKLDSLMGKELDKEYKEILRELDWFDRKVDTLMGKEYKKLDSLDGKLDKEIDSLMENKSKKLDSLDTLMKKKYAELWSLNKKLDSLNQEKNEQGEQLPLIPKKEYISSIRKIKIERRILNNNKAR